MAHGIELTGAHDAAHEHEHPGERTYIKIAAILSVITLVEVIIYYLGLPHDLLVGLLLVLSAVKFATVVGYFMHLKFDDRRLLYIFAGGLVLGLVVLLALDALHKADSFDYAQDMLTEQAAPATSE